MGSLKSLCCAPHFSFFSSGLWIEGAAEQQLKKLSLLEGVVGTYALPDLHPGKAAPIGSAVVTRQCFYPHLAGNDLGCGVFLGWLDTSSKLTQDRLLKKPWLQTLSDCEAWGLHDQRYDGIWQSLQAPSHLHRASIGGGNHFLEIGQVDGFLDDAFAQSQGITQGSWVVMVHSGSRHLGDLVARTWTDVHGSSLARPGDAHADIWWSRYEACLDWARCNRIHLAEHASELTQSTLRPLTDTIHNSIERLDRDASQRLLQALHPESSSSHSSPHECVDLNDPDVLFIHRKGASEASQSYTALPGSRGDYSFVLEVQSSSVIQSAWSLAHGSGRKWRRSDCQDRLSHLSRKDLERSSLGSRLLFSNKDVLYEEAPQAYKKSSSVVQALEEHGLVKAVARIKPVLTLKL